MGTKLDEKPVPCMGVLVAYASLDKPYINSFKEKSVKKHLQDTNYPELPYNWTIVTVEGECTTHYYGKNTKTGQTTEAFLNYGNALKAIESIEPGIRA